MDPDELSPEEILYFKTKYGLADHHFSALADLMGAVDLQGAVVLEIGGSNLPRELVVGRLGAESWHCVDMLSMGHYDISNSAAHYAMERIKPLADFQPAYLAERYNIFEGSIHDADVLPRAFFDVAVSIDSFEHLQDISGVLQVIRRRLKPGGLLMASYGPIWSSQAGHLVWVDDDLNFDVPGALPPFIHLLSEREEAQSILAARYGSERAQRAITQIYDDPFLNRMFYEDFEAAAAAAGFAEIKVEASFEEPVDEGLRQWLEDRYPGRTHFGVYSMRLLCKA